MPAITAALSAICGTGVGQTVDQLDFHGSRYVLRFVLQAVARADFDHFHFAWQCHG
jgi:hypothetical protein